MKTPSLVEKIQKLKREKRAVILAHNYQRPEVQDIADFVGDSLELSLCAAQTDAKVIVFCGVKFMAETAAILNPDKLVLLPDKNAWCPMAAMLPAEVVRFYRDRYPKARMVLYINSLAEAKAYCDAVCTSANSAEIINRMDSDTVLFGPDSNLAKYAQNFTEKRVIPIPSCGFCPVHKLFNTEAISRLKRAQPDAEVMAHPECEPEVWRIADFVGSTSKMCREALVSDAEKFIVATEVGLLYRMKKERKDASFIPAYDDAICSAMKLHTLEKVYLSLKHERYPVKLSPKIMALARKPVEFMLKTKETTA
ncbi:MAG: quinolinate synthetase [Candidatus Bathyarchaeota archaeon B26-2]|nr:MAG: quinolinate synthetase [Candidatus Bathyarchaeota archaeon B26-2]